MAITATLHITSPAFKESAPIPSRYTCDADDINPALHIESIPAESKTLALIMDDPDAPRGTYVHWVVWNIRPAADIPENSTPGEEGRNDFGRSGYGGPCPPSGIHRYYFKIYALDTALTLERGTTKQQLLDTMEGHVLAQGQLMGTYARGS